MNDGRVIPVQTAIQYVVMAAFTLDFLLQSTKPCSMAWCVSSALLGMAALRWANQLLDSDPGDSRLPAARRYQAREGVTLAGHIGFGVV
jgi:hypothetical protein